MTGTGQGVDPDTHAVPCPIVNGVVKEGLQHFDLETNAASGGVFVRRSASNEITNQNHQLIRYTSGTRESSPLGHISVTCILYIVVDRSAVIGIVTLGIEVISLEVDLTGLVHRENVAGQGLRGAVAARVFSARCVVQEFISVRVFVKAEFHLNSHTQHLTPSGCVGQSPGDWSPPWHIRSSRQLPLQLASPLHSVSLWRLIWLLDYELKITQWRRTRARRRAQRCST